MVEVRTAIVRRCYSHLLAPRYSCVGPSHPRPPNRSGTVQLPKQLLLQQAAGKCLVPWVRGHLLVLVLVLVLVLARHQLSRAPLGLSLHFACLCLRLILL